jgi:hypothetical protein
MLRAHVEDHRAILGARLQRRYVLHVRHGYLKFAIGNL